VTNYANMILGYLNVGSMSQDMASYVGIFLCPNTFPVHFYRMGGDCHGLNSQITAWIKK